MRQQAAILFLSMCASGLVVAANWDLAGPALAPSPATAAGMPGQPGQADAGRRAAAGPELTVTFQGQPTPGREMHASVSAPEGAGIVSWTLDDAPAWVRLAPSGAGAVLSGIVPADADAVSFTVAATDAAGRTFYAGSGDMPLAGEAQVMTSDRAIGSAMALPPAAPPR